MQYVTKGFTPPFVPASISSNTSYGYAQRGLTPPCIPATRPLECTNLKEILSMYSSIYAPVFQYSLFPASNYFLVLKALEDIQIGPCYGLTE